MSTTAVQRSSIDRVQMSLDALHDHFDRHFDRGWLTVIIEDLPLDASLLREIRSLLSLPVVYADDLPEICYGIARLRIFVTELRRHLMPVLRDRLGVSGFGPRGRSAGRLGRPVDERVHRQFLCMTFPHNLDRLEALIEALESEVDRTSAVLA